MNRCIIKIYFNVWHKYSRFISKHLMSMCCPYGPIYWPSDKHMRKIYPYLYNLPLIKSYWLNTSTWIFLALTLIPPIIAYNISWVIIRWIWNSLMFFIIYNSNPNMSAGCSYYFYLKSIHFIKRYCFIIYWFWISINMSRFGKCKLFHWVWNSLS